MYANMYGNRDLYRRYEKGVMYVSVEKLQTCGAHIPGDMMASDRRSHHSLIVPVVDGQLVFIIDFPEGKGHRPSRLLETKTGDTPMLHWPKCCFPIVLLL